MGLGLGLGLGLGSRPIEARGGARGRAEPVTLIRDTHRGEGAAPLLDLLGVRVRGRA